MSDSSNARMGRLAILVAVVALLVGANALRNELVYDAQFLVKSNATFRDAAAQESLPGRVLALNQLFKETFWDGVNKTQPVSRRILGQFLYRPLMLWPMGLIYVTIGDASLAFNILNLAFHVLAALLVFRLAALLGAGRRASACAALLFAAHPIHSEAIAYVAGLGETQSVLLALCSMVLYLTAATPAGVRPGRALLSLLAFAAALFTKESAAMVVVLLLLADVARGENAPRWSLRLLFYLAFLLIIALNVYARYRVCGHLVPDAASIGRLDNPLSTEGWMVRLATGVTLFTKAIQLFLLPLGQSSDYSFNQLPIARSLADPYAATSFAVCALMTVIGFLSLRRRPALGFGLLVFLFAFGAVSNIPVVIGTIFGERLLYLPSIGLCLAAGALLDAALRLAAARSEVAARAARGVFWAVLVVLSVVTAGRNSKYQSIEVLYNDMVETAPQSARAYYQRGELERKLGAEGHRESFSLAAYDFRKAIEILPEFHPARIQLATVLGQAGKADEALKVLQEAWSLVPDDPKSKPYRDQIVQTRAVILAAAGGGSDPVQTREILQELTTMLEEHVREDPSDTGSAVALGLIYLKTGRAEEADALASSNLLNHPDDDTLMALKIQAVFQRGDLEEGRRLLDAFDESTVPDAQKTVDLYRGILAVEEAMHLEEASEDAHTSWQDALERLTAFTGKYPDEAEGFYYRGYALLHGYTDRLDQALEDLLKCVQLKPSHEQVFYAIGQVLIARGNFEVSGQALQYFEELKKLYPDNGQFWLVYGRVLGGYGKHEEAVSAYEKAIALGWNGAMAQGLRAMEMIELKRGAEALEILEREEKELELQGPTMARHKGIVLFELERLEDAAKQFDHALRMAQQDARYTGQVPDLKLQLAKTLLRIPGRESEGFRVLVDLLDRVEKLAASPQEEVLKGYELKTLRELKPYVHLQLAWAYGTVPSLLDKALALDMLEKARQAAEELKMTAALRNDILPALISAYEEGGNSEQAEELRKKLK
ncbi:MAG: hypothetical protein HY812_06210 [Planctomycetes bacterium]|nr:hypothetical protein [Planctomycetota bacterium]